MELFLTVLSGIAWTVVYVEAIRIGFTQRTFAIPAFALALNVTWEVMYGAHDLASKISVQSIVDVVWALLDIVICVTFVLYGRRYWPTFLPKAWFYWWAVLMLVTAFGCQWAMIAQFGSDRAGDYSAFLQNLIMSALFLSMFVARRGPAGQSMLLAVSKCVGTLAPTITFGIIEGLPLVLVTGAFCFVFDVIYIGLLYWAGHSGRLALQAGGVASTA